MLGFNGDMRQCASCDGYLFDDGWTCEGCLQAHHDACEKPDTTNMAGDPLCETCAEKERQAAERTGPCSYCGAPVGQHSTLCIHASYGRLRRELEEAAGMNEEAFCCECLEPGAAASMIHDKGSDRWAHRGCVDYGDGA